MSTETAPLLTSFWPLLKRAMLPGPVLDLACGEGHNGMFLARKGLPVVFCDRSEDHLHNILRRASEDQLDIGTLHVDLEKPGSPPLAESTFGAILVFRYLHRPLIPHIRNSLNPGGYLFYETFTTDQIKFGKPCNPQFLLKPGELLSWFRDWRVIHYFEGTTQRPLRAVAQLICQRPGRRH